MVESPGGLSPRRQSNARDIGSNIDMQIELAKESNPRSATDSVARSTRRSLVRWFDGLLSMEQIALGALVAIYLFVTTGFALVTPYGEAPDEDTHILYTEHLILYGTMPLIAENPYTVDAFHPPLYYALGAAIIAGARVLTGRQIDRPIAPKLIHNPEFRFEDVPGASKRMFLPTEVRWPLWPYTLRLLSVLAGLGVILLTYATARLLVPRPAPSFVPIMACAFAALLPQANFIRASFSNENFADFFGSVIIWLLVLHLTRPYNSTRVYWIGVAVGLGLLTKLSVSLLVLPILLVLWLRREGKWGRLLHDLVAFALFVFIVAGWLYIYRWIIYGDPLAIAAWHRMLPPNSPLRLGDFFWFKDPFVHMLWTSFWGCFGWQVIFLPDWIYDAFTALTLLGIAGGVYLLVRGYLSRVQQLVSAILTLALLLMYALVIQASTYLYAWQGREMYPALSSVCVLLGLGLGGLALGKAAIKTSSVSRYRQAWSAVVMGTVVLGLLSVNIYSIIWLVPNALEAP